MELTAGIAHAERLIAIVFGVVVFFVAAVALRNDWKSTGLENQVFKLMLALLALGAILGILAGAGVLAGRGVA